MAFLRNHQREKDRLAGGCRSFSPKTAAMIFRYVILMILCGLAAFPKIGAAGDNFFLRVADFGGKKIVDFPLRAGDTFFIRYIHSSDGTPVRDTFLIGKDGQLILVEEAYLWYGAGLEFQKRDGVQWTSDGRWSIIRLDRILPELRLRIGRVAQQILVLPDRVIPFDTLGRPGEGLIIAVAR